MSSALWVVLLLAVFGTCRWSASLLDRHYGDRGEIAAVALVVLCVLLPMLLGANSATIGGLTVKLPLALTMAAGLLLGRHTPTRRAW